MQEEEPDHRDLEFLYSLIISQMLHDGYHQIAEEIQEIREIHHDAPVASDRLLHRKRRRGRRGRGRRGRRGGGGGRRRDGGGGRRRGGDRARQNQIFSKRDAENLASSTANEAINKSLKQTEQVVDSKLKDAEHAIDNTMKQTSSAIDQKMNEANKYVDQKRIATEKTIHDTASKVQNDANDQASSLLGKLHMFISTLYFWRVTTIHNSEEDDLKHKQNMELSFEYLMNKNSLKWVTISSENAMLISVCLQSMVDELINQKDGNNYSQKVQSINYTPMSYVRRDGGGISRISESSSSDTISSLNDIDMPIQSQSESFSMRRRLQNKISTAVFFRNGRESVHNEAFEGIGDDDL